MNLLTLRIFGLFLGCIFFSTSFSSTRTPQLFVKNGNIYISQDAKHYTQLTSSTRDREPVLSSDEKLLVFIRKGKRIAPEECRQFANIEDKFGNEIWLYFLKDKKEKRLVENNFSCDKPEEEIVDPNLLQFSIDNKTVYFLTSAWVTSGALHKVNIDGTHQQYMMPANSFYVVRNGRHRGDLIVRQHRYLANTGSVEKLSLIRKT